MGDVQEKTEVVVEEYEVEEPIEEAAPKEEVKESDNFSKKSNRELVEEAQRQVEEENKNGPQSEEASDEDQDETKDIPEPPKDKPLESKQKDSKQPKFEKETLKPPQRFTAEQKQIFNKAPQELKTALHRMVTDMEGKFTKTQQEYKAAINNASELLEVVKPFAANLAEQGFSVPKGVAQLLGVQAKLTNPQTKDDTYVRLGLDVRPTEAAYKKLGQALGYITDSGEETSSGIDISNHPVIKKLESENKALRDAITPLHTERQEQSQRAIQDSAANILAELESVKDETDNSGTYLYPKLHDDGQFIERWKPLVSALVRAIPGLTYADAAKRAYLQLEASETGNLNQAFQNKLPARNNSNINERARNAASSVRGRSAPPSNGFQMPDKLPTNNRDLVRLAAELVERGG